jgi:hypothetical protein
MIDPVSLQMIRDVVTIFGVIAGLSDSRSQLLCDEHPRTETEQTNHLNHNLVPTLHDH